MERLKTSLIGKWMYPLDNGYQYNLLTGEMSFLRGVAPDFTKKVLIVSEPYKLKVMSSIIKGKWEESEFVTVLYEGEPYICTNYFSEEAPELRMLDYQYTI